MTGEYGKGCGKIRLLAGDSDDLLQIGTRTHTESTGISSRVWTEYQSCWVFFLKEREIITLGA